MKNEDRWEKIVNRVDQRGFATVQELSEICDTSVITIRRDLAHLDGTLRLRRTHGGASSLHKEPLSAFEMPSTELTARSTPDQSIFNRLDALITADTLPIFGGLLQKSNAKKRFPIIAESLPIPDTEACIMIDNYHAGVDLGEWAAHYAQEHWQGRVRMLDLTYHRPNTQARSQGFMEGLRSVLPSAQLLLSINTFSRYDMAYQLTRDALSVHPDVNLIFAINDTSAHGAFDACQDLGISPDDLIILTIGIEGPAMIDLMMQKKWIRAGVCMFPEIVGTLCIEAAIAAWNNQPLPAQVLTPYCIATPDDLPALYQKTAQGWRLQWDNIPCKFQLPLPVQMQSPDKNRPLPGSLGFICTFVEHDWYKTMARMMKEYTDGLGIQLEVMEFGKTMKEEIHLRRVEIARRAAYEVKSGDTIFIDGGPISQELAEQLVNHQNITVITNSMPVMDVFRNSPGDITLISTGGAFRRSSQVFVGPTAESTLKEFRIDKLFLMVSGVSKNLGLYHTNISEVTIKQGMIRSAREVILLADYDCFQQEALIQVAPMSAVHKVITDDALPASVRLELGTLGISVILASM